MGKYLNETLGFQGKYLNAGTQSQNTAQQSNSQTQQVQQTQQPVTNSGLVNIRLDSQQRAEVLKKVSIPMYFKEIIIPQLNAEGYYDNYPVNFDNDPRACCPLHDEDTPSFRYYEDTSSFYCFGCQKGGNVINLHRYFAERMNGREVDRDEASAFLYNYFIKGKEQSEFIQSTAKTLDKQEEKSTTVELIKLNAYRSTLERDITFDKTISLEVKEQVWKIFDNVDVLVSKNIISATDAMNYIKQEVNKLV